jgi:hypothetical protein
LTIGRRENGHCAQPLCSLTAMAFYSFVEPLPWRRLALLQVLGLLISSSQADLVQTYCSPLNTGTDHFNGTCAETEKLPLLSANSIPATNLYNSNGACSTACRANYALAVVKGQDCWCSNFIPASQNPISSCADKCPGYPFENCGSSSANLYGYVQLDKAASGTASSSSSPSVRIISRSLVSLGVETLGRLVCWYDIVTFRYASSVSLRRAIAALVSDSLHFFPSGTFPLMPSSL